MQGMYLVHFDQGSLRTGKTQFYFEKILNSIRTMYFEIQVSFILQKLRLILKFRTEWMRSQFKFRHINLDININSVPNGL